MKSNLFEEEKLFMSRIEMLCEEINFPEIVNHDYSIRDWTYKKLCIIKFTDRHKFWILIQRLKTLRYYLRSKDNDKIIIGGLVSIIAFCLAWICVLVDWEEYENSNHRQN